MALIKCIASGSKGNCWVLDDGKEILVIDCGVPVKDMKIGIDFQIIRVVGCIVSHSHRDHDGYTSQYEGCGLNIYKPFEAIEDVGYARFGSFFIQSFPLVHDVPCYGFLISNPILGRILYITDTEYVKYRFKSINFVIIEANYDNSLLSDDLDGTIKRDHVLRGHMEIKTTQRFLEQNCDEHTQAVILTHLSADNADRDAFLHSTQDIVHCPVWIAKKGLVIKVGSTTSG